MLLLFFCLICFVLAVNFALEMSDAIGQTEQAFTGLLHVIYPLWVQVTQILVYPAQALYSLLLPFIPKAWQAYYPIMPVVVLAQKASGLFNDLDTLVQGELSNLMPSGFQYGMQSLGILNWSYLVAIAFWAMVYQFCTRFPFWASVKLSSWIYSGFVQYQTQRKKPSASAFHSESNEKSASARAQLRPVLQSLQNEVETLRHQVRRDVLTRLNNREAMQNKLKQMTQEASLLPINLSVILLDIDNFKSINDSYGHSVGDQVLIEVAKVLSEVCGKATAFSAEAYRYGSEEFCVTVQHASSGQAAELAETLRHQLEATRVYLAPQQVITASFGLIHAQAQNNKPYRITPETLIERADALLYQAKAQGKNRVAQKII